MSRAIQQVQRFVRTFAKNIPKPKFSRKTRIHNDALIIGRKYHDYRITVSQLAPEMNCQSQQGYSRVTYMT